MTTSATASARSPDRIITEWVLAPAALVVAALVLLLWPRWRENPDLSHGYFVPVIFLLLLHENRRRGPWRWLPETTGVKLLRIAAVIAGLVLVVLGGLFAAAVDWTHPLVSQMFACATTSFLFAALLVLSGDGVRHVPFNWTSLVAIGLWPLSAAIPPGTYQHITLTLQLGVTRIVLHALHLLGIPASTTGTVIELARTTVGVEEACSGVRSLVSCIVAGLFFSATLVRAPWKRVLIVTLAIPLAIGMNILRSLALTLFANAGIDIGGSWHDFTGFAVLGVTSIVLGGLALWLEDRDVPAAPASPASPPFTASFARWSVPAGLVAALLLAAFFVFNTHGSTRTDKPAPNLATVLPAKADGWNVITTRDLYQFSEILQTRNLIQRSYVRPAANGSVEQVTFYVAYWAPGQAPVSLVSTHTPAACWPGSGWENQSDAIPPSAFLAGGKPLPAPEYRMFKNGPLLSHVWYWHLYEGRPLVQVAPNSPLTLLKLALRYGFRKGGDQLFIRISSNRSWEELRDDPLVVDILSRLEPLGLY
ncbi:MAG: exosortase/archaeosortase family protein [Opitutaceae bacterium]|jgi:exosortase